ncbi:hypothetical protein B0H17DRAFT_1183578, partial [Mycena rosella]
MCVHGGTLVRSTPVRHHFSIAYPATSVSLACRTRPLCATLKSTVPHTTTRLPAFRIVGVARCRGCALCHLRSTLIDSRESAERLQYPARSDGRIYIAFPHAHERPRAPPQIPPLRLRIPRASERPCRARIDCGACHGSNATSASRLAGAHLYASRSVRLIHVRVPCAPRNTTHSHLPPPPNAATSHANAPIRTRTHRGGREAEVASEKASGRGWRAGGFEGPRTCVGAGIGAVGRRGVVRRGRGRGRGIDVAGRSRTRSSQESG